MHGIAKAPSRAVLYDITVFSLRQELAQRPIE
jgi:hypothetical protein